MLVDGIILSDSSVASNFQIQNGTTLPASGNNIGELFFKTSGAIGLYAYDGSQWVQAGASGSSSFSITGDVTGTIDGGTDTLTLATVNSNTGSFGSASSVPVLTVNSKGLVTAVSTAAIPSSITLTGDATASGSVGSSTTVTLAASGVSAGSYGSSTAVPVLTVDAKGRITSASTATVQGLPTQTSHSGEFLTTDGTNASWAPITVSLDSLNVKAAVRAATTANITRSGEQTIDGVSVVAGDRVLVKDQTTGSQNGIYVVASGSWARSSDFDGSPSTEVKAGDFCFVSEGTTNGDTGWILTNNGTVTIGSTALTFAQFTGASGPAAAGTLTGTTLASNVTASSLTSVGTITSGTWSGSFGAVSGANLTSLNASNLSSGTVATARLGTGTASSSTYLRGDGTWTSTPSPTTLEATASHNTSSSTTGVYIGTGGAGGGFMSFVRAGAGANNRVWQFTQDNNSLRIGTLSDDFASGSDVITMTRSGITSGTMTLTASSVVLSGASLSATNGGTLTGTFTGTPTFSGAVTLSGGGALTGTFTSNPTFSGNPVFSGIPTFTNRLNIDGALTLNSAAGTAGQVLTSQGSGNAPIWTSVSAAAAPAGTLTGTTLASNVVSSSLTSVGTLTSLNVGTASTFTNISGMFNGGLSVSSNVFVNLATTAPNGIVYGYLDSDILNDGPIFIGGTGVNVPTTLIPDGTPRTGSVLIAARNTPSGNPCGISLATNGTSRLYIYENGSWGINGANTGSSGQVLTSNGSGSSPTWTTVSAGSAAAGSLTGTTLAANVVSSSLTSVGTITSGTWSGSFGTVSGANLTSLNASNLSTGTVATARLGTGTASSSTYLRGDGTWAVATAVGNLPVASSFDSTAIGQRYVTTSGITVPATTYANSTAITAGDIISVYNNTTSPVLLTVGSGLTMYKDGTAGAYSAGQTISLAARGTCAIWYRTATEAIVSGSVS